jgi:hypothetical protein
LNQRWTWNHPLPCFLWHLTWSKSNFFQISIEFLSLNIRLTFNLNYTQLLLWRVDFITNWASYAYSLQVNELMYVKKTNKVWKTTTFIIKYKITYNRILYTIFFFLPPPLEPRAWHIFYLFVSMLKAFAHALRKSKFLHACIQPYVIFNKNLYVSLEVDIIFFYILRT